MLKVKEGMRVKERWVDCGYKYSLKDPYGKDTYGKVLCLDCSNVNTLLVILCYSFISDYITWANYVKDTMNFSIIIEYNASQIYNHVLKILIKIFSRR